MGAYGVRLSMQTQHMAARLAAWARVAVVSIRENCKMRTKKTRSHRTYSSGLAHDLIGCASVGYHGASRNRSLL